MDRRRRCCSSTAGLARSQPSPGPRASGALASLPVAGGAAALARLAGVDIATPRGLVLLQVIRAVHESPAGADPARDRRIERLHAYLADLSGFLRARRALPDGRMSASLAQSRESRRAVEDAARAVGGELDEQGGVYRLRVRDDEDSTRRRQNLEEAGLDLSALAQAFNGGKAATLTVPVDDVPLPLDVGQWARLGLPLDAGPEGLLMAMLGDRRASLLYSGLMSLDAETRAYVGARPALAGQLLKGARPAIFASLGRSIRVRAGAIDVPGGSKAVAAWEALLRQRAADPEAFILELLDREGGRAALLYDAIDHLDPPRQAFALALRMPDSGARADRLRALLAACAPSLAGWDPEVRPFRRVIDDPVHLLVATHVLPSGDTAGALGPQVLARGAVEFGRPAGSGTAAERRRARPRRRRRLARARKSASRAWARRQQLLRTWLFGQRVFAGLAPVRAARRAGGAQGLRALPDAPPDARAPRGGHRPAAYAAAVRHAQQLSEIGDQEAAATRAAPVPGRAGDSRAGSIQPGGLRGRRAPAPRRTDQPAAAATTATTRAAWARGWTRSFCPHSTPVSPGHATIGRHRRSPPRRRCLPRWRACRPGRALPAVEWEGLPYRVDVGMAEFARMVRIRRKQGGHGLDAVLAFGREPARIRDSLKSPADVAARVAALTSAADALASAALRACERGRARIRSAQGGDSAPPTTFAPSSRPKTSRKARAHRTARFSATADALLAGVLVSLAYAPHLGDPDGPELLAGDPATRHSFGFEERIEELRVTQPVAHASASCSASKAAGT